MRSQEAIKLIPLIILGLCLACLGSVENASGAERQTGARVNPSDVIARVGDYELTVQELNQIIESYRTPGQLASRDSKRRLVESLLTTKLFALAARSAKLDAAADFAQAKEKARQDTLIYTYLQRYVQPKFSEPEARKYFAAHPELFKDFNWSRNEIVTTLKDRALEESNQALLREWEVKERDEPLRMPDLFTSVEASVILADVGSTVVTVGDLRQLAISFPRMDLTQYPNRKELLEILVLERLYALAAEKAGLQNDPVVQKALARSEENLLASRYTQHLQGNITLEEARKYYQAHPEEFRGPDQIHIHQIVVSTETEALQVKAKLEGGALFEDLASALSTDRDSRQKGGDAGWVRKGTLYPEVERVAFEMKPGQISPPVKTTSGYFILRVDDRIPGVPRPFELAAPNLISELRERAVDQERKRLMTVHKITINEQLL